MTFIRLVLASLLLAAMAAGPAHSQDDTRAVTVLELFTSQGCSGCPAADALLGTLQSRDDIIALSLPVDYWDYLGWKDTLARPEFTKRQRDYAKRRGDGHVYTPQIVVNGQAHVIGSKRETILAAIEAATRATPAVIPIVVSANGKLVTLEAQGPIDTKTTNGATLWLASVRPQVSVEIKHGENRGRTMVYNNVVRALTPIGTWNGERRLEVRLPIGEVLNPGEKCAVLIQSGPAGPILAAAWLKRTKTEK